MSGKASIKSINMLKIRKFNSITPYTRPSISSYHLRLTQYSTLRLTLQVVPLVHLKILSLEISPTTFIFASFLSTSFNSLWDLSRFYAQQVTVKAPLQTVLVFSISPILPVHWTAAAWIETCLELTTHLELRGSSLMPDTDIGSHSERIFCTASTFVVSLNR